MNDDEMGAVWLLLTGTNILFMQAGFMMLEVGASKAKNVKSVMFKNLLDHAVCGIAWYCIGFPLATGNNAFASGTNVQWFDPPNDQLPKLFQLFGFCVTCCTVVSGAVLGRLKLEIYVLFSLIMSSVVFPVAAHWAWAPNGWLRQLGFQDFAGSCVVHLLGASCALMGAICVGPRVGRFSAAADEKEEDTRQCIKRPYKRVRDQPGYSPNSQILGAMLLYVAWFSFNIGSGGGMDASLSIPTASHAAVNTMLASSSGTIAAFVWNKLLRHEHGYDLELNVNGMLSSLVSITACCAQIHAWAAIVVGLLSVLVYVTASTFILHVLHIDDVLRVGSIHGACGALGTIWLGFAHPTEGVFYGGSGKLLGVQLLGCVCVFAWGAATSTCYFYGLRFLLPFLTEKRFGKDLDENMQNSAVRAFIPTSLCYSRDEQLAGIDFFHFGGNLHKEMDIEEVAEYNATQRIKQRYERRRKLSHRMDSESTVRWPSITGGIYEAESIARGFSPPPNSPSPVERTSTPLHMTET